jgi:pimeloyl-ACP methyl ester carboxylesterase
MGSELVDAQTGRSLWGLRDLRWYVRAWCGQDGLKPLHLSPAERDGETTRVKATGLLKFPAFAPWLGGFEPYTPLVKELERTTAHPDAVMAFPNDWRLPCEHNARLLARAAARHLKMWRSHRAYDLSLSRTGEHGRLVIVAHSMGGLLARALALPDSELDPADVRTTITLGTPFFGSVKAAMILNSGRGAPVPLPRSRLKELAATMPGIHDLLPTYRCVDGGADALRLTAADVGSLGGDEELADQSADFHRALAETEPIGHRSVVGVDQPTPQSLVLDNGVVHARFTAFEEGPDGRLIRRDRGGDGTVYRESAALTKPFALPQQHGALARTREAVAFVRDVVREPEGEPRPLLATGRLGADFPDIVETSHAGTLTVTGLDNPAGASCRVFNLTGMRPGIAVAVPNLGWADGDIQARIELPEPGLYRIEVDGTGFSPVTQLALATP